MEIFKLVGSIMVDSSEAESSLQKTDDKASSMADTLAGGAKTAASWAAGITGAAIAVGAAMVDVTKETATNMDTIDKASQRMGIAAESYQELAYAAELSGVSMSTMEKAAKQLEGTDLSLDDALDQLMQIEDAEERAAAAASMFGENVAYQMTPLLNAGAEGLDAMKQEANDLGLVMSEDAVKAGAEMNDTFTKLEDVGQSLMNQLGVALMPVINDIANKLLDFMPTIQGMIEELTPIIDVLLENVGGELMTLVEELLPPLLELAKALLPPIVALAEPLLSLATTILKPLISLLTEIINVIGPGLAKVVDWIAEKIETLVNGISGAVSSVASGVSSAWNSVKSFFGFGGSHASGLAYVPYDGYQATLHRGETVLNSNDASQLLNQVKEIAKGSGSAPQTITIISQLDGREVARNQYDYLSEIGMLRGATV